MLPENITDTHLAQLVRDEARLAPALDALCTQHGLTGPRARYAAGSVPVWSVGEAVVKLYPPQDLAHWHTEVTVLSSLRLPVPTPGVRHAGQLGAWHYLVMDRLQGVPLDAAWGGLDAAVRLRLAGQVGELLAALHHVPVPVPDQFADFAAAQAVGCTERQRQRGLAPAWADQIDDWLRRWPPLVRGSALLHTEVMPAHLLVEGDRLTGLVDFEPAMAGEPEYDLASVGVFLARGDRAVFDAVVRAWRGPAEPDLARRVMTWALLHRYSRLAWYLDRVPAAPGVNTIDALAVQWFGAPGQGAD